MDLAKATDLESRLRGRSLGRWTISSLINHGKSAAVFRADAPDGPAAVKVFDDALIERYGDETQFARIEREQGLIGYRHPNLVRILGGGFDEATKNHYLVMELIDGPNLKQCLQQIPAENIRGLVTQLASGARFLEELGYCHRDIKPENICLLDDYNRLVLLDFGVIRPVLGSDLTDLGDIQSFVGTLQYSSPEFLLRQEEDSPDGWRALTFYQIGGVLHDLIMRRALFAEFAEPYARLVNAVQHMTPQIQNTAVARELVDLARCCLIKDWRTRLRLVSWPSFDAPPPAATSTDSAKQRVTARAMLADAQRAEAGANALISPMAARELRRLIERMARTVDDLADVRQSMLFSEQDLRNRSPSKTKRNEK